MTNLLQMLRPASGIQPSRGGSTRVRSSMPTRLAEGEECLDVLAPQVVGGVPVVIPHPARGAFHAVVELQVRDTRRVRLP